jgi:glycosyltransferase involved in cell wall biosynthesis
MKLVIQIPCYNEEDTLRETLADLPTQLEGIDCIEIQVVDDGSTDRTVEVAKQWGVQHIVGFKQNRGLAAAFKAGIDNAILNNADILVNTDADNQYCGQDIAKLVRPIVQGHADMVIGCRPIDSHPEFSYVKKQLQKTGSWVLRRVSKTKVRDAASGFRAYSKDALFHINVYSDFSYCLETLIQAGYSNLKIDTVEINVNPKTRESRLFRNAFQYVWKQTKTMINIFLLYRANVFFNIVAFMFFLLSVALGVRYLVLVLFLNAPAGNFWPTVILAGVALAIAFQLLLTGILASLISSVRKLSEDTNYRIKKLGAFDPKRDDEIK